MWRYTHSHPSTHEVADPVHEKANGKTLHLLSLPHTIPEPLARRCYRHSSGRISQSHCVAVPVLHAVSRPSVAFLMLVARVLFMYSPVYGIYYTCSMCIQSDISLVSSAVMLLNFRQRLFGNMGCGQPLLTLLSSVCCRISGGEKDKPW